MNILPKIFYFFFHHYKGKPKVDEKVRYGDVEATVLSVGSEDVCITWIERRSNYSIRKTEFVPISEIVITKS